MTLSLYLVATTPWKSALPPFSENDGIPKLDDDQPLLP